MKLWENKFKGDLDDFAEELNSSISVDQRLVFYDIKGSLAHSKMLYKQNIIEKEDYEKIKTGLIQIREDLLNEKLQIDMKAEDVHSFVEGELVKRVGDSGKKLHTGRSRNDQVTLDLKMYVRDVILDLEDLIKKLIRALVEKSKDHLYTYMPGYTHLQIAQPITFAYYLNAYAQMFKRDLLRLEDDVKRMNYSPLGSGALSTSSYPVDRFFTAKELGFFAPTENALDSVSDRDYVLDLAYSISVIMMHLSRFCEELILFSSKEFSYIRLSDRFTTGSSIMPQKKNPDMCELIRAKAALAFGNLSSMLTLLKALPLAYNKDMQEDKELIFRSIDTVNLSLKVFIPMIESMEVNDKKMKDNCLKGFINATDLADYLTKKGIPFRDSYKMVSEIVHYAIEKDTDLSSISLEEYRKISDVFENDLYEAIDIENIVDARNVYGSCKSEMVKVQIENILKFLKKFDNKNINKINDN